MAATEKTSLLPKSGFGPTEKQGDRFRTSSRKSGIRRHVTTLVATASALALLWTARSAVPVPQSLSGALRLSSAMASGGITPGELKEILLTTPSNDSAAEWLRYYTAGPHMAGQNYSQATWTRDRWTEWGAKSHITAYDLYLNRPVEHALSLLRPKATEPGEWDVTFEASLEEDVLEADPTTGLADGVPTFHGYSASGNVTGPLVYVNYGTYEDYADLQRANISLEGAIAIARYGGIFRGLKVKRAQDLGAVGVLLYSDPGDDGEITEENGYAAYPDGPARQPSSVQRGSVQFLSVAPGDPTTPGYPSKPGVPRGPTDKYIPSIPSLPISYVDAVPLLQALNGHGPSAKQLGQWWDRKLGLHNHGVDYNVGPTPATEALVHLYSAQAYTTTPIWDVVGVINGSALPNEVVVVGNHRDAWIIGGAADPNSGSAVLNEVVRAFGEATARGWQPLRTIVFASWDGEEYGLLGSTEWVEEYLPWLSATSLAYVNIDVGVSGTEFSASAVPLLHDLLHVVAGEVASPNQTVVGQTIADTWSGHIGPLGSGSDYTAFLDHAGIASLDVGFGGGPGSPVYHYHSNYDSYHWMATYCDPGFVYHAAMARLFGLLVARLADDAVVPFRAADYAAQLLVYVAKIRTQLAHHDNSTAAVWTGLAEDEQETSQGGYRGSHQVDEQVAARGVNRAGHQEDIDVQTTKKHFAHALDRLEAAVADLAAPADKLDDKADSLRAALEAISETTGWLDGLLAHLHRIWLAFQVAVVNHKYQRLERQFLYDGGLDGRDWFKHVVYAPGLWTGYAGAVFPGLVENIDAGNWTNAIRWADIIESRVRLAAKVL
ncbi:peptidase s8/s53 [Grosmannia clavigera kw1407]|uniref:Peptidase s8/s53 n=1 Tax=Grosmannia clavigera (strain kw1407 / UAMH 11150) TaxID=655863 RepID=F0XT21_GROCL|nr:peptidase s8/s53 [Grosmannia clavigera kw1407]EFW99317.1 peptidase s8/s53 [Grosmannia clavigera kw1407]